MHIPLGDPCSAINTRHFFMTFHNRIPDAAIILGRRFRWRRCLMQGLGINLSFDLFGCVGCWWLARSWQLLLYLDLFQFEMTEILLIAIDSIYFCAFYICVARAHVCGLCYYLCYQEGELHLSALNTRCRYARRAEPCMSGTLSATASYSLVFLCTWFGNLEQIRMFHDAKVRHQFF